VVALRIVLLPLAMLAAVPAHSEPMSAWRGHIVEASLRFGVPQDWIERVMGIESGGHTRTAGRPTTSPKGAMGLMQIMPATWAMLTRRHGLGSDPYDPRANILAGAAYLRAMHDRFGYPGLFGAYNAGPARYAAYLRGRSALPAETRTYLARLAGPVLSPPTAPARAVPAALPEPPSLFALQALPDAEQGKPVGARRNAQLFVALRGR